MVTPGREKLTVRELVTFTGLSYNTVKRSLIELKATEVPSSWPTQWALPVGITQVVETAIDTQRSIAKSNSVVKVEYDSKGNWPGRWEAARSDALAVLRAQTFLGKHSDPAEMQKVFADAARIFASMAYDLKQVQDSPDWLDLLDGQIAPEGSKLTSATTSTGGD